MNKIATGLCILLFLPALVPAQIGWKKINKYPANQVFTDIVFIDANRGFYITDDGAIGYTTNGGEDWGTRPSGTTEKLTRIRFTPSGTGHITGLGGTLLRSTDAGMNWTKVDAKTNKALFDVHFFDDDNGFVAGQGNYIARTTDAGATWLIRDAGFGPNNVNSICFASTLVGAAVGNVGNIAYTTNGGSTWRSADPGLRNALYSVSFANTRIGTAVGEAGTILHTTNGGRTWVQQYAEVPLSTYALQDVQHADSAIAFIVGWNGMILRTTNEGQNWVPQDNETTDPLYGVYFLDTKNGYAAGFNGTILRTSNGGTLTAEPSPAPLDLALESAFPNPVERSGSASLTVGFTLPQASPAEVVVVDALGQTVAGVFAGQLSAGKHQRSWNASSLPAGVYFYRLRSAAQTLHRKFVIAR